jgi:hypothetical protein
MATEKKKEREEHNREREELLLEAEMHAAGRPAFTPYPFTAHILQRNERQDKEITVFTSMLQLSRTAPFASVSTLPATP